MGDSKKKRADSGDTGQYGMPEGGGALELAEPTRDYMCASGGGAAVAWPDEPGPDDDVSWEDIYKMLEGREKAGREIDLDSLPPPPSYTAKEIFDMLEEGHRDVLEGRTQPAKVAFREIRRKIANNIRRDIENGLL
ncbi:MAG: hypothetical protein FWB85_01815 [Chitinispirillia bacterium]|nr:hypothetical protein [Chitinispirillia bacterium]MCL2241108.1 hypothetical protein [Chitinispirillia bacterium]